MRLVRHRATGKKFVLREFTGSAEVYRQLLRYTCKNLPEVFEVASQGDRHAVLEEFVEGDNLGVLLQDALFSPKETRQIVLQVCQALWVLHSMAAVHRDVKPENIILRGPDAVLIDFDAARYGLSQSDIRTDIYSLGVLINVMLTGEHPSKKLAEGRMGRVVQRCTQVNPAKRYQNVLRLMEAIR